MNSNGLFEQRNNWMKRKMFKVVVFPYFMCQHRHIKSGYENVNRRDCAKVNIYVLVYIYFRKRNKTCSYQEIQCHVKIVIDFMVSLSRLIFCFKRTGLISICNHFYLPITQCRMHIVSRTENTTYWPPPPGGLLASGTKRTVQHSAILKK